MDFKKNLAVLISENIKELSVEEILDDIEEPKNKKMGDFSFPCFKLAKTFKKSPNIIASEISSKINSEMLSSVETVNAYINFRINKKLFADELLKKMSQNKTELISNKIGNGKKVVVEFSSVNVAKPFHIGHLRTTMIGNSLYRIYKSLGYEAIAINHIGDYGTQFGKLISAYNRWGDEQKLKNEPIKELLNLYIKFHEEAEKNPSLDDEARAYFTKLENKDKECLLLWNLFRDLSLKEFGKVYKLLDVEFDSYNGESFYSDKMDEVVDILKEKNLLIESEGAEIVDLSEYNLANALIKKSDGSTLYLTRDLAAAIYRERNYNIDKNIYVVAYQQDLHFKQLFKVLELMGFKSEICEHVNFGMVSLEEGTMATRAGRVVYLLDVLEKATKLALEIINKKNPNLENKETLSRQIGIGAIVFQDLYNQRIKDYTFSWKRALSFEGESGPYVQYAHVRATSLIEKSKINKEDAYKDIDTNLLDSEEEIDLIKTLLSFEDVVIEAAKHNEPSKIARYAVSLAGSFNSFYNNLTILDEKEEIKKTRMSLVFATQITIKKALYLLGLKAPDKM